MDFLTVESLIPFLPVYLDNRAEQFAIVDRVDFMWANRYNWAPKLSKQGANRKEKVYAYRTDNVSRPRTSIFLHKEICFLANGRPPTRNHVIADHKNGESLDCRRHNLVWATRSQNRKNINGSRYLRATMTDEELAKFIGLKGENNWREIVARISPNRRATFNRLKQIEDWDRASRVGPVGAPPEGVMIDLARSDKRKRGRL